MGGTAPTSAAPARPTDPTDAAPSGVAHRTWSAPYSGVDLVLMVLLCAATALYLAALPRNLSAADESVYLYEAKRVFEGQVLYRDVFEITTPGWIYLMAALFRLFGVSLATARIAMAVLHGLTAAAIYATGRRFGIRAAVAWLPALAFVVVCQPAWPIASQHWLGTFLAALLLLRCARLPGPRASWAVVPGVLIGLMIGVHQQRGVCVGAGVFLWLIADHLLRRRYPTAANAAPLLAQLAALIGGAALVVVPMCAWIIASAGFDPVWKALVIHPLFNYRSFSHAAWGKSGGLLTEQGAYTFPRLLKYLPLILLVDLGRLARLWIRREDGETVRRLALLILFGLTSMLSIAYFPDFIHIAFIAPVFFIAIAEAIEAAAPPLVGRSPARRIVGWAAALFVLAAAGVRLHDNLVRSRAAFPISRETAFGRVDWSTPFEARLYDTMRDLMRGGQSRELFCYPIISSLYLTLDADNPTRFQFLLPSYSGPAQMQEVVETLQRRQLPYIVALTGFVPADDPVVVYLRREYEPVVEAGDVGQAIFRRKTGAAPGAEPPASGT